MTARKLRNRKLKRKLFAFGAFFVSLMFLTVIFGYRYFSQQFSFAQTPSSYNVSTEDLYTILYISSDNLNSETALASGISYVLVDKRNKKILVYKISPYLNIDMPGNFGLESLSKALALGRLNSGKGDDGIKLLESAIRKIFGYKVDKFLIVDKSLRRDFNKFFDAGEFGLIVNLENVEKFRNAIKTDMNLKELYDLYAFVRSLPEDRFSSKDINEYTYETDSKIDDVLRDITFDSAVSKERKSISILNGTNISGMATFGTRAVTNLGGRVVAVNNATHFYDKSALIVDDISSESVRNISHLFGIANVILKSDAGEYSNENELTRSDITLIIGFDRADLL